MSTEPNLYFIALVPPEPYFSNIAKLKRLISESYGSKAALKSPPHITLQMPFRLKEAKEGLLKKLLISFSKAINPLQINQEGFGCFEPRVIYINVEKSKALASLQKTLLLSLRKELKLDVSDYKNRGFTPHLTIAFRDLKKANFYIAWDHFSKQRIKHQWVAEDLVLLKHDGAQWEIFERFSFRAEINK